MGEKVDFLGLTLDNVSMEEAVARVEQFIQEGRPRKIFAPNAALFVWSRSDPELRRVYETCDLVPVDGIPIYYASRLLGNPLREPISAVFLMFELIKVAAEKGYRLYLLGTKEHILQKAVRNLREQYPSLNIAGWHNGYFTIDEEPQIVKEIADVKPDILFIAMSSPLKEHFVERNLHAMGVPVCLGVGGSFDIVAGEYKLAPNWMRRLALEWVYRLIQEPRRMWNRYLTTTSVFLFLVLRAFVRNRLLSWISLVSRSEKERVGGNAGHQPDSQA